MTARWILILRWPSAFSVLRRRTDQNKFILMKALKCWKIFDWKFFIIVHSIQIQLWIKKKHVAFQAPSLFLIQSWLRIECTMMKNFQLNIFQHSNAFIKINLFWSVRLLWTLKAAGRLRVKRFYWLSDNRNVIACQSQFSLWAEAVN